MMPQPSDKQQGVVSKLLNAIHPPSRAYFL